MSNIEFFYISQAFLSKYNLKKRCASANNIIAVKLTSIISGVTLEMSGTLYHLLQIQKSFFKFFYDVYIYNDWLSAHVL